MERAEGNREMAALVPVPISKKGLVKLPAERTIPRPMLLGRANESFGRNLGLDVPGSGTL
jgi:hypothetical protein